MDNQTEYAELEFIDEPIYIHPKEIFVSKIIDDIEIENKSNTFFDDRKDMIILDKNTDVYTDTGKLLLKFRTNVIPDEYVNILYNNMKSAAPKSGGRSESSGKPEDGNIYKTQISKNGKILRLLKKKVRSGITGYYDSSSMFGHISASGKSCRETAFTAKNLTKFNSCIIAFKLIDDLYIQLTPDIYCKQKEAIKKINPEYVISDTVFTTVTVNKNFRTALHKDKGDFDQGLGTLVVCSKGTYEKGYTLFPQYNIGVDCRNGDFLLMDVHEWHCNAPIIGDGVRLSFVLYLREKMIKLCPRN